MPAMTAHGRFHQPEFKDKTIVEGGKLMCKICRKVLDHTRKSSVEIHFLSRRHLARMLHKPFPDTFRKNTREPVLEPVKRMEKELYEEVVNDVIEGVRKVFLDEGDDDKVLEKLKELWLCNVKKSKVLETAAPVENRAKIRKGGLRPRSWFRKRAAELLAQDKSVVDAVPVKPKGYFQQLHKLIVTSDSDSDSSQPNVHPPATANLLSVSTRLATQTTKKMPASTCCSDQFPFYSTVATRVNTSHLLSTADHFRDCSSSATPMNNLLCIAQLDGRFDCSSSSDSESYGAFDVDANNEEEGGNGNSDHDYTPLNSDDDSDTALIEFPDLENVIYCHFAKVSRYMSNWRLLLHSGIMTLHGQDRVFQTASGHAPW